MRKKEIIFGIIVGLLLLVVLGVCEEVKVSNGTTIINKKYLKTVITGRMEWEQRLKFDT